MFFNGMHATEHVDQTVVHELDITGITVEGKSLNLLILVIYHKLNEIKYLQLINNYLKLS